MISKMPYFHLYGRWQSYSLASPIVSAFGRLKWHPMSPPPLVLVAWMAYSDWVISPLTCSWYPTCTITLVSLLFCLRVLSNPSISLLLPWFWSWYLWFSWYYMYRWVPLKPDFLGAWKCVQLKHYPAYPIIIISLIIERNLATKIWAKWESGLTAVRLKQDPPVPWFWVIICYYAAIML